MTSPLTAAFSAAMRREGRTPPRALRIFSVEERAGEPHGSRSDDVPPPLGPGELGAVQEASTTSSDRRRRGAWYTPSDLADRIAVRALDATLLTPSIEHPVLDPACGGGGLLLAACALRVRRGEDPARVLGSTVGIDVDPVAVAVAEAELWWWAARHGAGAVLPDIRLGDGLLDPLPSASVVVANPPFRTQLRAATADAERRRGRLTERWGDAVRPYTDTAWLFLLAATESATPGAGLAVLQPQSVLAARDAGRVRSRIEAAGVVLDCEIVDRHDFEADVEVCLPVIRRTEDRVPEEADWTGPLADAVGVPRVRLDSGGGVLGDRATVKAGFRDEFYGLVGSVSERGPGPRLVTVGAIDPWTRLDRPVRFAGTSYADPRVDVGDDVGRAADWVRGQRGPKILVATQTRIVEAVADPDGAFVAGVPALAVLPGDPADLWHLLAILCAPPVSAHIVRVTIGTGLARGACRPTAGLLGTLPLPVDAMSWDEAANAARRCHEVAGTGELDEAEASFAGLATAMYGAHDDVRDWWLDLSRSTRRRRPSAEGT